MIEKYLPRIHEHLGTDKTEVQKTDFGYAVIKGNWFPPANVEHVRIGGRNLDLRGKVLHERVLVIECEIPIRSHQEVEQEIVTNIGGRSEYARIGCNSIDDGEERMHTMNVGETIFSVYGRHVGFNHGFQVEMSGSCLYIAKALKPEFVEGNSFRMPENLWKGKR